MEDHLHSFLLTEGDLNYFQIEDELNIFVILNLIIFQMEDDLNSLGNGRQPLK